MNATYDTTDLPPAAHPPLSSWARFAWTEGKLVMRDTSGLLIPVLLPVLILVMNGLGATDDADPAWGGLTVFEVIIVPIVLVMVVAVIGIVNMPSFLASHRRYGILRRLSVTPARPLMVLTSQVVVSAVQTLGGILIALVIAVVAFDLAAPRAPLTAVGVFALTALAMYGLGLVVAATAPTPNASVAIGLTAFFATMALGGGFGGRDNLPGVIADVGSYLPFGAGIDALGAAWLGDAPDLWQLLALAVTAVVGGAVGVRVFRWT